MNTLLFLLLKLSSSFNLLWGLNAFILEVGWDAEEGPGIGTGGERGAEWECAWVGLGGDRFVITVVWVEWKVLE